MPEYVTFSIRLSGLEHDDLKRAAEHWGIGRADVVRMAIRAFGRLADGQTVIVPTPAPAPTPSAEAAADAGQGVANDQ